MICTSISNPFTFGGMLFKKLLCLQQLSYPHDSPLIERGIKYYWRIHHDIGLLQFIKQYGKKCMSSKSAHRKIWQDLEFLFSIEVMTMCDMPYKSHLDGLTCKKTYVDNFNGASIGPFYSRSIKNKRSVLF